VIALVGLAEKRDARVKTLSGGQKRRLDLGVALVGDPDLLFLDEPTTGFDPAARRAAWEMIRSLRSLGKTVLLTTHYLDDAEQLVFWRSKEAALFIFLFPVLLFLLLGSVYNGEIYGVPAPEALLAGLIGYGCANTAFAGLAIQLVLRRESAILKRLRATPLPPATYVAALLVSTMLVFTLQAAALFLLGRALYGTPFPSDAGSFVAAVVIGAAVFAALGTATASVIRSAEGSSAVVNFVLLPTAFLPGSFGPTRQYPAFLRGMRDVLPLR